MEKDEMSIDTFPISEIVPGSIYLGNQQGAGDLPLLNHFNVKVVINITTGVPNFFQDKNIFEYYNVRIKDERSNQICEYFPTFTKIIHDCVTQKKPIFVHCVGGISRSSSMLLAYLMKYNNWRFYHAFQWLRKRRGFVLPNLGFVGQLLQYEKKIFGNLSSSTEIENDFSPVEKLNPPLIHSKLPQPTNIVVYGDFYDFNPINATYDHINSFLTIVIEQKNKIRLEIENRKKKNNNNIVKRKDNPSKTRWKNRNRNRRNSNAEKKKTFNLNGVQLDVDFANDKFFSPKTKNFRKNSKSRNFNSPNRVNNNNNNNNNSSNFEMRNPKKIGSKKNRIRGNNPVYNDDFRAKNINNNNSNNNNNNFLYDPCCFPTPENIQRIRELRRQQELLIHYETKKRQKEEVKKMMKSTNKKKRRKKNMVLKRENNAWTNQMSNIQIARHQTVYRGNSQAGPVPVISKGGQTTPIPIRRSESGRVTPIPFPSMYSQQINQNKKKKELKNDITSSRK